MGYIKEAIKITITASTVEPFQRWEFGSRLGIWGFRHAISGRILAKQAIVQQGAECHSWAPPTPTTLVEDVREGMRHVSHITKQLQQSSTININTINTGLSDLDINSD